MMLIWHAALGLAFALVMGSPARALDNSFPTSGDTQICSGRPWIDVLCNGADPAGVDDSTSAIQTTINSAVANNWPVHIPSGTYKLSSQLTIDYAGESAQGFRLISEGATLNGTSIASGPVLQIQCGGGTPASPTTCFYFKEEGTLFVDATTPAYAVVFGKTDFSDQHNSAKIDHLLVNNASSSASAGGCQYNSLYDSDLYQICVSNGGAAGLALEQTQFSRISGAATAQGTGGRGLLLENGYNFSNTFFALDLEVSPTCLGITDNHNGLNTWISPYFNCTTAVNATASSGNTLINPNYGGSTVNYGPNSVGMSVVGTGSRVKWIFPVANSYTAAPIDDGLAISSYNALGAALTVTLPAIANVNAGWTMGFATDNGKGVTVATQTGSIISGSKSLSSITLGAGNYEYIQLQSDGNNWRIVSSTRNTRLSMGLEAPPWPANWLYPSTSGYATTASDNGNILSSYNTASGLTVTLPPNAASLPTGWSMGFATDNNKILAVQVSGVSGGRILYPGSGPSTTAVTMAANSEGAYEFMVLQYDGAGNFRILDATPQTMQAIGVIGSQYPSHWSFPGGASAYTATVADGGNVISSYNSPASSLAVTLPSTTAISMGWTIGFGVDNNKPIAIQVNGVSGGKILYPEGASGNAATSISLAPVNYEFLALQFDGSNFRIISVTPRTAGMLAMLTHQELSGASPALSCGTGASIHGNDGDGYITVGTSPSNCQLTFVTAWSNPPICVAVDMSRAIVLGEASGATTTQIAFTGTLNVGDIVNYHCSGYQ